MEVKFNSYTGNNANNNMQPQQRMQTVASMIDDMRCDDQKKRIAAIKNLTTVAATLGPDRTRAELLPYLQEIIMDDDDETLLVLADSVGSIFREVGGAAHALALIGVLEKLCTIEEPTVRERVSNLFSTSYFMCTRDIMQKKQKLLTSFYSSQNATII